jgi:hypothetical protein
VSFKQYLWEETALKIRLLEKEIPKDKLHYLLQYSRLLFAIALEDSECPVYLNALENRESSISLQKLLKAVTLINEKPNGVFAENL